MAMLGFAFPCLRGVSRKKIRGFELPRNLQLKEPKLLRLACAGALAKLCFPDCWLEWGGWLLGWRCPLYVLLLTGAHGAVRCGRRPGRYPCGRFTAVSAMPSLGSAAAVGFTMLLSFLCWQGFEHCKKKAG